MKLSMINVPDAEDYLRALKQVGVDVIVHYQAEPYADRLDDLRPIRERYARLGLAWKVAEAGPAIDRIVLGKDGAAEQTERYKRTIANLGALGVEVIAYNFMPQVDGDAMVVRTSYRATTRGGAVTSRFRAADARHDTVRHAEKPIARERMWENLERFLRAVLPAAEDVGVRLAIHPDDPPLSPLCSLERIMDREESFDRLLAFSRSPANALTFCVGCFAEMGADVPRLIERYGARIANVHLRNIAGTPDDFVETFPDDGAVDLVAVLRKLQAIGFDGYLRSDHAPRLATDPVPSLEGYGVQGHLYAIGFLRGVLRAIGA